MSLAIITQTESNTANGGSAQGYLTGSDTTSAADTFYGRRLTNMWVNESFSGTPTVNTFTASTGGAGAVSTAGTFTLVPGTYRVTIDAYYAPATSTTSVVCGLYNVTSAAFEVQSGTAEPILSTPMGSAGFGIEGIVHLDAIILVATTNKTYQISHKASTTGIARTNTLCGRPITMTGANVNGAAAKNTYCIVKIVRTA